MASSRTLVVTLAVGATLILAPARATAAKAERPVVAVASLVVGEGVPSPGKKKVKALTKAISEAVKVAGGRASLMGSGLAEVALLLGCSAESPDCLASAVDMLDAGHLLHGTIGGDGTAVSLVWVHRGTKAVIGEADFTLGKGKLPLVARDLTTQVTPFCTDMLAGGYITLEVVSTPAGATVHVDGAEVGATPYSTFLKPGTHEVRVVLDGYLEDLRSVEATTGSPLSLTIPLRAVAPPVVPIALLPKKEKKKERKKEKKKKKKKKKKIEPETYGSPRVGTHTWVVLGAGLAVAAAGGVFRGITASIQRDVNDAPISTVEDFDELVSLETKGRTFARLGGGLLIGGGALVAMAGTLLVIDLARGKKKDASSVKARHIAVTVAPMPMPDGGGLVLRLGRSR